MSNLELAPHFCENWKNTEEYLDELYELFLDTYIKRPLLWKDSGTRVSFRRQKEVDNRHASFWHIVSGGDSHEEDRVVDFERCRRIGWIRPLIESFNSAFPHQGGGFRWWISPSSRSKHSRYCISTLEFDYIVILEERPSYTLLITAYYVNRSRRRKKFMMEYQEFLKKQEPLDLRTAPGTPSTSWLMS